MSLVSFIGAGNMARAIIGGLVRGGTSASDLRAIEPDAAPRRYLQEHLGVAACAPEDAPRVLADSDVVVWAVKPQVFSASFAQGDSPARVAHKALHLSVMAGIPCRALQQASGSTRIVRAMPNTPALIGLGITGLYQLNGDSATDTATATAKADRSLAESLLAPCGDVLWFAQEAELDVVTAISGSGPAYVFAFLESLAQSAVALGLTPEVGARLAATTLRGAAELARREGDGLEHWRQLRERVTAKGGTTQAALEVLHARGWADALQAATQAARQRAQQLAQG